MKEDGTLRFLLSLDRWKVSFQQHKLLFKNKMNPISWLISTLETWTICVINIYTHIQNNKSCLMNLKGFLQIWPWIDYLYFHFDPLGAASGETRSPNSLCYNLVPRSTEHLQPCFTFCFSFRTHVLWEQRDKLYLWHPGRYPRYVSIYVYIYT